MTPSQICSELRWDPARTCSSLSADPCHQLRVSVLAGSSLCPRHPVDESYWMSSRYATRERTTYSGDVRSPAAYRHARSGHPKEQGSRPSFAIPANHGVDPKKGYPQWRIRSSAYFIPRFRVLWAVLAKAAADWPSAVQPIQRRPPRWRKRASRRAICGASIRR